MVDGLIIPPGEGRKLVTRAQEVTFKVTGAHARAGSVFEIVVPPGFDVGAHVHARSEEIFYILDGELEVLAFEPQHRTPNDWKTWQTADGRRPVRVGAGSCMFVPPGCPHAFTNPTDTPARMLFQSSPPPDHERYFEELLEIFDSDVTVNSHAVQRLREKYDIQQLTALRYGVPTLAVGGPRDGVRHEDDHAQVRKHASSFAAKGTGTDTIRRRSKDPNADSSSTSDPVRLPTTEGKDV